MYWTGTKYVVYPKKKIKANCKPHNTDNSSYVIQTNQQKRERGSLHILHIGAQTGLTFRAVIWILSWLLLVTLPLESVREILLMCC